MNHTKIFGFLIVQECYQKNLSTLATTKVVSVITRDPSQILSTFGFSPKVLNMQQSSLESKVPLEMIKILSQIQALHFTIIGTRMN